MTKYQQSIHAILSVTSSRFTGPAHVMPGTENTTKTRLNQRLWEAL